MKYFLITYFILIFFIAGAFSAQYEWAYVADMPIPVKGAKAVVKDSLIYVIGGFTDVDYQPVNNIQIYNPKTDSWQISEDTLMTPRYGFCADNYRQDMIMFGGVSSGDSTLEMWDFKNPTYKYDKKKDFDRLLATANVYQNDIYIFGGYSSHYSFSDTTKNPYIVRYNVISSSIEDLDYITGSTYPTNQNPVQQMSTLVNFDIFILGGALNGVLSDVYKFDIVNKTWQLVDISLLQPRAAAAAVTSSENMIVVAGGYNETSDALNTVEIFDPSPGELHINLAEMQQERSELTAVIYDDTLLYVFGGANRDGDCLASVEKLRLEGTTTPVQEENNSLPAKFELYQNYPNPFNPVTTIGYNLDKAGFVDLSVYNILGKKVLNLVQDNQTSGYHSIQMDASNLPSGIYFYRLSSNGHSTVKQMVVIR